MLRSSFFLRRASFPNLRCLLIDSSAGDVTSRWWRADLMLIYFEPDDLLMIDAEHRICNFTADYVGAKQQIYVTGAPSYYLYERCTINPELAPHLMEFPFLRPKTKPRMHFASIATTSCS